MAILKDETIEKVYQIFLKEKSDINEHLPTLRRYAEKCSHVTEFGVRWGRSTIAFLAAKPKKMVSYDIANTFPGKDVKATVRKDTDFNYIIADVLQVEIEPTDLLFIDTFHTKTQLQKELELHADKAKKHIILHDTSKFGVRGEDGGPGLIYAINSFLGYNKKWEIFEVFTNCNGLMVLKRKE